ncbi:MAG: hypothetical protein F6K55_03235 [Moorea sp. SIO4A3]|nr:hypothetical protein [Moorena sp. SIO4A3]
MPTNKFTVKAVLQVLAAVEKYGFKETSAKIVGVDRTTLAAWERKCPEFASAIAEARLRFQRNNIGTELGDAAIEAATDLLRNGKIVKTIICPGTERTTRYDAQGKIIFSEVKEYEETVKETHYPAPEQMLERFLAPYDLNAAIAAVKQAGFYVGDPNAEAIVEEEKTHGITDDSASLLKGKILGVNFVSSQQNTA